jgi:hypothetical protein
MKRILAVLAALAVTSACAGTGPAGSPSGTSPGSCAGSTCRFEDDVLTFDYPAGWRAATFEVVSSFSTDLVYLSTAPLSDPCDRSASGVDCVRLAATALGTNGVLVTWRSAGFPGWTFDPGKGSNILVGQRRATVVTGPPSDSCQAIGGVSETVVTIASSVPDNWTEVDACLAGPDPSVALSQVDDMLKTVRWKNP